jgi:hypothetical protein
MAQQKPIAGTAYFKVNGRQYSLAGKITVKPAAVNREGLVGLSGVAGFKETPVIPSIEIELFADQDTSVLGLNKITDETVTAELVSGMTYVLRNAWQSGDLDHDGAEGKVSVTFQGKTMEESKVRSQ